MLSGFIWVLSVFNGYEQTTLVGNLRHLLLYRSVNPDQTDPILIVKNHLLTLCMLGNFS